MSDLNPEDIRASNSSDPLDQLRRALVTYDQDLARTAINVIMEKIDPTVALTSITGTMGAIGDGLPMMNYSFRTW